LTLLGWVIICDAWRFVTGLRATLNKLLKGFGI